MEKSKSSIPSKPRFNGMQFENEPMKRHAFIFRQYQFISFYCIFDSKSKIECIQSLTPWVWLFSEWNRIYFRDSMNRNFEVFKMAVSRCKRPNEMCVCVRCIPKAINTPYEYEYEIRKVKFIVLSGAKRDRDTIPQVRNSR